MDACRSRTSSAGQHMVPHRISLIEGSRRSGMSVGHGLALACAVGEVLGGGKRRVMSARVSRPRISLRPLADSRHISVNPASVKE